MFFFSFIIFPTPPTHVHRHICKQQSLPEYLFHCKCVSEFPLIVRFLIDLFSRTRCLMNLFPGFRPYADLVKSFPLSGVTKVPSLTFLSSFFSFSISRSQSSSPTRKTSNFLETENRLILLQNSSPHRNGLNVKFP